MDPLKSLYFEGISLVPQIFQTQIWNQPLSEQVNMAMIVMHGSMWIFFVGSLNFYNVTLSRHSRLVCIG